MSEKTVAVAVLHSHEQAVAVVRELHDSGFDMQSLSVVGKGFYSGSRSVSDDIMGPRIQAWGRLGEFWGTIWGLVARSSFFRFSDLGSVLVAGPLVGRLADVLGTRVAIDMVPNKKGKLVVEFADLNDLERRHQTLSFLAWRTSSLTLTKAMNPPSIIMPSP